MDSSDKIITDKLEVFVVQLDQLEEEVQLALPEMSNKEKEVSQQGERLEELRGQLRNVEECAAEEIERVKLARVERDENGLELAVNFRLECMTATSVQDAGRNELGVLREKTRDQKITIIRMKKKAEHYDLKTRDSLASGYVDKANFLNKIEEILPSIQTAKWRNNCLEEDIIKICSVVRGNNVKVSCSLDSMDNIILQMSNLSDQLIHESKSEDVKVEMDVDPLPNKNFDKPADQTKEFKSNLRNDIDLLEQNLLENKQELMRGYQRINTAMELSSSILSKIEVQRNRAKELLKQKQNRIMEIVVEREAKIADLKEEKEELMMKNQNHNILLADLNMNLERESSRLNGGNLCYSQPEIQHLEEKVVEEDTDRATDGIKNASV